MDLRSVFDPDRAKLIALGEKGLGKVAVAVVPVVDLRAEADAAPFADLDHGAAREEHVVGQVGPVPDDDAAVARDLGPEVTTEFDPPTRDESTAVRGMQAEARSDEAMLAEHHLGVRVAELHPALPDRGHRQRGVPEAETV